MAVRFQTSAGNYHSRSSDLLTYNSAYTWMAWCTLSANTGANALLYGAHDATFTDSEYLVTGGTGDGIAFKAQNGAITTGDLSLWTVGETAHFAIVRYTSTDARLFKNGVEVGSITTDVGTSRALNTMASGGVFGSSARWDGKKFAEKAWQTSLTAAEIVNEMWSILPKKLANLYAFWPGISDNITDASRDMSGSGRNWTINGTVTVEDGGAGVSWGGRVLVPQIMRPAILSSPGAVSITSSGATPQVTLAY